MMKKEQSKETIIIPVLHDFYQREIERGSEAWRWKSLKHEHIALLPTHKRKLDNSDIFLDPGLTYIQSHVWAYF